MYPAVVGRDVLYMTVRTSWFIVLSPLFLTYLLSLIIVRGVLQSSTIVVELCISLFDSVSFCFMYFMGMSIGMYMFIALFWLLFICNIFFHPFIFNLFLSLDLKKWVSCRQHVVELCVFIHSANLCYLIGEFKPFTSEVIIYNERYCLNLCD